MGRLLPDSLTWRFALLLAAALIAANVVAGVLLSTQRQRLDDAAREAREIERITSLVPALEAVSRSAWRAIERDASTQGLIEEALNDLFRKYNKSPIA